MAAQDTYIDNETAPKGKRTIRYTVRGTVMGYIGRTKWECFGERFDPAAEGRAQQWLEE